MKRARLWTPGDWNAFFGFGTNILVNLLVVVFGRILPGLRADALYHTERACRVQSASTPETNR